MDPINNTIISGVDRVDGINSCVSLKSLSSDDIFIKKGEYKGYQTTFIKFQSEKKYNITRSERVATFIQALSATIFSVGFALFLSDIRERWSIALSGKKHSYAYIEQSLLNEETNALTVKELVLQAVRLKGSCLKDVSKGLKNDEEVVSAAISHCTNNGFLHASEELRGKKHLALKAIQFSPEMFQFASKALQADAEVLAAYEKSKNRQIELAKCLQPMVQSIWNNLKHLLPN